LLNPLYIAVSWVLLQWHRFFSLVLDEKSGLSWALAILFLVVTIRLLLFRFTIKQVHSQRKMQEMQPKIQALRDKYKNDRQTLSQEMMKLQREEGFNPIGGCLPVLLQAPIFLSLFHVLRLIGTSKAPALVGEYHWTQAEADAAGKAKLFGGAPIAAAFRTPLDTLTALEGNQTTTRLVTFVLIVLMCAATFITQKQIMSRSGQVLEGQQAMIQKLLLYGMPISLFVSGFLFPLGVLLYWFTNNLWTMGQQFYILRRHPHPNAVQKDGKPSAEAKALAPRPGQKPVNPRARRGPAPANGVTGSPADVTDGSDSSVGPDGAAATAPRPGQRPANPKGRRGATPAGTGPAGTGPAGAGPAGAGPAGAGPAGAGPAGAGPAAGETADAVESGPDGQTADAAEPADGGPSAPAGGQPAPGGGPTNTPRPARRPPSRSSTTTRPKKKRR
jgi:YidC/Oxa1 family membrane protein insertase